MEDEQQIIIYKTPDGETQLDVRLENETVWLNQYQISELFQTDRTSILRHIRNIFNTGELDEAATCAKIAQVRKEGNRNVTRNITYYNLDLIISVGYRVNSKRGTFFRQWANKILKEHLIKGYTLNERRLREQRETELQNLKKTINLMDRAAQQSELEGNEAASLIHLINDYAYGLALLDQYDHGEINISPTETEELWQLTYDEAMKAIHQLKASYGEGKLFGNEKDESFQSSLNTIYQTFDGQSLYPSIEKKAANLIYLIIKNHSFSDGNKRIGAYLFLVFLEKNNILFRQDGERRIANNALVSLTLMIAESNPDEKHIIVNLVVSLISSKN